MEDFAIVAAMIAVLGTTLQTIRYIVECYRLRKRSRPQYCVRDRQSLNVYMDNLHRENSHYDYVTKFFQLLLVQYGIIGLAAIDYFTIHAAYWIFVYVAAAVSLVHLCQLIYHPYRDPYTRDKDHG